MRIIAALCIAALTLGGCQSAHVRTTVERDATTGHPRFVQDIKAPPGVIAELVGQNFMGSLVYNPETKTYDIEIRSGQDVKNVQTEGMQEMTTLLGTALIRALTSPAP